MLIKKLSRILAISALAFVAVLLWNTKSSQADESSKLLNNATIQKIVKKGTLNVGVKQDVPNFGYYSAKTNTYQGMEIDLAKKIAKELKVKVILQRLPLKLVKPLWIMGLLTCLSLLIPLQMSVKLHMPCQILTTMTKLVSSFKPNLAIRNFLILTVKLLECLKGHLPKPLLKSMLQLITLSSTMSNSDHILS